MATVDRKLLCLYPHTRPVEKETCDRMFECSYRHTDDFHTADCKLKCGHFFHFECLRKWDRKRIPCPQCHERGKNPYLINRCDLDEKEKMDYMVDNCDCMLHYNLRSMRGWPS
ncbi:hypothetical protein AVEN_23533-1 [Araneus ventricosus]|uniref:RING-type domain-containing protein n=1 Tax=Araneus ventricosus TaxID=182803 RepID=A0A4Y2DQS7_ARAVE|nr:hypothetical protein AVEN_23533-1 [Araneus ventricosus]